MQEISNFSLIMIMAGGAFVLLLILGMIFARLYTRATKETSFVRTGMGGEKVIKDGGALVLPVLHDVIFVNMNTLRLEVLRKDGQALITKDRMRVDINAEFYVRVRPDSNSIATAAQTLGHRTQTPDELRALVEGKFVDVLRAVGATMTMEELHENRVDFVQRVQEGCAVDLEKNGLELESVSLTGLDQTAKEFFNPDNAFDAEGLTKLTQQLEDRKKIRNDIEQDTRIQIARKKTDAEKDTLEISRDEEFARIQQERDIENQRAESNAEIAKIAAEQRRESEEADIEANRRVALKRIAMEQETENRDIEKAKTLEIAHQDQEIAVSNKSREESEAKSLADKARAVAAQEEENVETVRATARAERERSVVEIKATEQANEEAIAIKIAAEARNAAANDDAEAVRVTAEAEAEATLKRAEAEAEGVEKLNTAKNMLKDDVMSFEKSMELIGKLPEIMAESMKGVEKIDSIKLYDFGGKVPGFGGGSQDVPAANGAGGGMADQITQALLSYRAHLPMVDQLLKEMNLDGATPDGIISGKVFEKLNKGGNGAADEDVSYMTPIDPDTHPGGDGRDGIQDEA